MLKFACPQCHKALRAEEGKAGRLVRCPACARRFPVPAPPDADPPEEAEVERTRRKKKRPRPRRLTGAPEGAQLQVLLIGGIVLVMHLLGLIEFLTRPSPEEIVRRQIVEVAQRLDEIQANTGGPVAANKAEPWPVPQPAEGASRRALPPGGFWLAAGFVLDALLLVFLFLRHNWARLALAIWYLLHAFCGLAGLLLGGAVVLPMFAAMVGKFAVVVLIVQLGVHCGVGIVCLGSRSLAAYTEGA